MYEQIEMLRSIVHRLIKELESFPENQEKHADFFQKRANELRTTIILLCEAGDHNFIGQPLFSFSDRLLCSSKTKITRCGYVALRSYLDMIKPSLNNPIPV